MSNFLIIYSSRDGQTKKICKRIASFLNNEISTELISLEDAKKINLSDYEKIVIGASIRYGNYSRELFKFVDLNKNILDKKNVLFFQ